jgi:hypothetical protein
LARGLKVGGTGVAKKRGKKKSTKTREGMRGKEDEGHTSSPRGTHKAVEKHLEGCRGRKLLGLW